MRPASKPLPSLMTPTQVAALFGVDPKTVNRWAEAGRLSCVQTRGGHRRYRLGEVDRLQRELTSKP